MPIRSLIFDCDGVLLDSVPVKTHAFSRLAEPFGEEARERFVRFHMDHGGVNRNEKFVWFFNEVLHRPPRQEDIEEWGTRFRSFCHEELQNCALIEGAREALQSLYGSYPLFVCSGAPREEQAGILKIHGLDGFFTAIYGAPPEKTTLLRSILEQHSLCPNETLMVGDASTDLLAATKCGTRFYGVGDQLKGGDYPWGKDLTKLVDFVRSSS
ncbi:MAG: HAD family hydrolase [Desulfovibrio sp.]|nr:HAD family hydrolase [Desulfovibrio sp.]